MTIVGKRRRWATSWVLAFCFAAFPAYAQTSAVPQIDLSGMRDDLALVLPALCQLAGGQGMVPDGVLVSSAATGLARQWNAPEAFTCAGISVLSDRALNDGDQAYREVGAQLLFTAADGRVALATVIADVLVTPSFVWITRAVAKPSVPTGRVLRFFVLPWEEGTGAEELARLAYPELAALLIAKAIEPNSTEARAGGNLRSATILAIDLARNTDGERLPVMTAEAPHNVHARKSWSLDGWRVTAISGELVFGDKDNPLRLPTEPNGFLEIVP